jgi:broad specificity phosphatase PhoE
MRRGCRRIGELSSSVDRDDDDCGHLKEQLEWAARKAGLTIGAQDRGLRQVVNRMAIEELEAWFFGDWEAVRSAYLRVKTNVPGKQKYRDPDAIAGGTWEALERILQRAGYFPSGLRKIEAARAIALYMEPLKNRSRSFRTFRHALDDMVAAATK